MQTTRTFIIGSIIIWANLCIFSCDEKQESVTPYTSYFTGNANDLDVNPTFGITMMGGRSEHNEAMKWFLKRANGGDILVLRASGSDGYNKYLFEDLGVKVNSVESLVVKTEEAANDPYVEQKIKQAEAIWLAGGDQWNYISIWGNSPMKQALQEHISTKKGVIGGTSAGMAVLGEWYFSAANGTIQSDQALLDPFDEKVQIDNDFLSIPILQNTITDTHYAQRNRQGRHVAFLSRMNGMTDQPVRGIACDEYIAICVGSDGIAKVYGKSPELDHAAYFITSDNSTPENLESGQPLHWNNEEKALSVYKVIADSTGIATFNLNDWQSGNGGEWRYWFIDQGEFRSTDQ